MIIRHDINPLQYLADCSDFPAVIAVDSFREEIQIAYDNIDQFLKPSLLLATQVEPSYRIRYDGMGMLIHPQWILTSAHVAVELTLETEIVLGDEAYAVERIVVHPQFKNYSLEGSSEEMFAKNDIALIQLKRAVQNILVLPLYEKTDELGEIVTFVGRGDFGNGLIGPDEVDGKLRKATNKVEKVDGQWLVFRFDAPPECTELEGISGPGDSGGPALIWVGDEWQIAGISSGQDSPENLGEGRYGVWEYYTRVSSYLAWIESVLSES